MNRADFIKMCTLLGISIPIQSFSIHKRRKFLGTPYNGKVVIIGAGAGGMTAGYLLKQQGTEVEILEASDKYGGRIRINKDFTDFPIPLGAEWIETNLGIFDELVNDENVQLNIETVADRPDRKFVNYSWFQFFEDNIIPSIKKDIRFNSVVQSIDYSEEKIKVATSEKVYESDKVIISVPLMMLKKNTIKFNPELPKTKTKVIDKVKVWEGFKAFIEFKEKFYDEGHMYDIEPESDGQKAYYDATHGQNSSKNIVGLFSVGKPAKEFNDLNDDQTIKKMLKELDEIYNGKATPNYVKHIYQNWNKEPFIQGGYLSDHAKWRDVEKLGESLHNKIFFAGGPYTDGDDWVSVHAAARSGRRAVEEINESNN